MIMIMKQIGKKNIQKKNLQCDLAGNSPLLIFKYFKQFCSV